MPAHRHKIGTSSKRGQLRFAEKLSFGNQLPNVLSSTYNRHMQAISFCFDVHIDEYIARATSISVYVLY